LRKFYIYELVTFAFVLIIYDNNSELFTNNLVSCLKLNQKAFMNVISNLLKKTNNEELLKSGSINYLKEKLIQSDLFFDEKSFYIIIEKLSKEILKYSESVVNYENETLVYLNSCLNNNDNLNTNDLREFIYNDLFLNSLVKIRHLNNLNQNTELNYKESFVGIQEEQKQPETNKNNINIEPPFLKSKPAKPYTLVLDLDETLVHYVEEDGAAFVQIRPYTEAFLETMAEYYELVIFTAALSDVNNL
jgi:TFIIF-interacting CTD phosphatase-like protein